MPNYRHSLILVLLLLLCVVAGCRGDQAEPVAQREITVYAAASLTDVLEHLEGTFEAAHPEYDVILNPAATSTLARQIEQGAPADVFFSASVEWMQHLQSTGHIAERVRYPVGNRLVVAGPPDAPPIPSVEQLTAFERLALADPEAVPAGIYAKQGLECLGLWDAVAPQVVPMLDVRTALIAVRSGTVDAAIVYASDLRAEPSVQRLLDWPEPCHPDIRYAVAPVTGSTDPEAARLLIDFLTDPAQDSVWTRFGFIPLRN